MNETFAGKNACNPEDHLRPFVIEWDGTDRSSFEAFAARDVVVVRYEGCSLTILDGCRDDSIPGKLGAYRAIDWTSGALESIDIENEGQLYAKLPLGADALGGRVQGGEQFHMEYYVAGTRTSTRYSIYSDDLQSLEQCAGATHFVYAYNLGAFALGSSSNLDASVGGSVYGFSAGAQKVASSKAEKKGGDLAACSGASATEVAGCKSPIRMRLRPISPGESPDAAASRAEDTDPALNKAGQVEVRVQSSEDAAAHLTTARSNLAARDGNACLHELDSHDVLDAKDQSTAPRSAHAKLRARCLMLTGKCEAGKGLMRQHLEHSESSASGSSKLDTTIDENVAEFCQGGDTSERDQLLGAVHWLERGSQNGPRDPGACERAYATFVRLKEVVEPRGQNDVMLSEGTFRSVGVSLAPGCFARAGKCERGYEVLKENFGVSGDPDSIEKMLTSLYDSLVRTSAPECMR